MPRTAPRGWRWDTLAAASNYGTGAPLAPRPYRCTGYPWLPAIYLLIAGAWALNTLIQRPIEALAGIGIVVIGVPGYLYWKHASRKTVG